MKPPEGRTGLIFGIGRAATGRPSVALGNLMGAPKVEHPGTQNQRVDFDRFNNPFRQQFGYSLQGTAL